MSVSHGLVPVTIPASSLPLFLQILLVFHRTGSDVAAAIGGAHPIPSSTLREFTRLSGVTSTGPPQVGEGAARIVLEFTSPHPPASDRRRHRSSWGHWTLRS